MTITGLQKLSLLDFPDRTCCTVFTRGCDFRCPFCHNAPLVLPAGDIPPIPVEEVLAFLQRRQGLLDGVCVSGGEPLLQPDIEDFLRAVKSLGYAVKLDTNGSHPQKLRRLLETGLLDYVAMDIKNSPAGYACAAGVPGFDVAPILESVALLKTGQVDYEFRTTVAKPIHTEEDFHAIAGWLGDVPKYYLQCFVDSGQILQPGMSAFAPEEMQRFLSIVKTGVPAAEIRGT